MRKTLLTLIVAGNLMQGFNSEPKADDNLFVISEEQNESAKLEYINEQIDRKIELSTILSHLKHGWYGFSNNPSKNERHIELEKRFYENIEKIKGNEFERAKKIYEYIVSIIPDYGLPRGVNYGQATLGQIINSRTGICFDKSNALYDALKFSGINSDVISGVIGNNLFHQWVRVYLEFNGESVVLDLDPTWYKEFTPIEPTTKFETICGGNTSTLNVKEYLKYCEKKTNKETDEIIGKYSLSDYALSSGLFIKKN